MTWSQLEYVDNLDDPGENDEWLVGAISDQVIHFDRAGTDLGGGLMSSMSFAPRGEL